MLENSDPKKGSVVSSGETDGAVKNNLNKEKK